MKEKTLREILAYYGMPEKNIESAITQIAQGYGACRYLEGVAMGAEATGSSLPIALCPMENHINNVKNRKIMSKRTNSIVAVTIAKYATVYVEADTPQEAAEIVKDNIDGIYGELMDDIDDQFEESEIEVDSYEAYTTECDDYMDNIWTPDGAMSYDEYMDALEV